MMMMMTTMVIFSWVTVPEGSESAPGREPFMLGATVAVGYGLIIGCESKTWVVLQTNLDER